MTAAPVADADPIALLGQLVGEHGLLEVAYRTALAGTQPQPPAHRWEPVLQALHRAVSLASGLAAGHTTTPTGYDPGPVQPCTRCGRRTAIRVYGLPWHYTCWLAEGCPTSSSAAEPAVDAPTVPASTQPAPEPSEAGRDDHSGTPAAPLNPARRSTPNSTFTLDEDEELADFARVIRKRRPEATDDQCRAALAAWHGAVIHQDKPVRFVSSPGYAGVTVYEWLIAQHGDMVKPEPLRDEAVLALTEDRAVLRVLSFVNRDETPVIGQAVTEADVTAQYLAAARSTELGDGAPVQFGPVPVDEHAALFKRPGYVQLGSDPNLSRLPVTARLPFATVKAGSWLPTPAARYLSHDHRLVLDVAGGYGWPAKQHGRRLMVWAALFTDGRTTLSIAADAGDEAAGLALVVLKAVYATFLGGMTRSEKHNDKSTLRPDWHDQYVMQAGVNALRAIDKALANGGRVLGGMKDSFWFLSDDQAPVRPAGMVWNDQPDREPTYQPGKWHVNRVAPVTEDIVAAHKAGRVGVLRKMITESHNAREAGQ